MFLPIFADDGSNLVKYLPVGMIAECAVWPIPHIDINLAILAHIVEYDIYDDCVVFYQIQND